MSHIYMYAAQNLKLLLACATQIELMYCIYNHAHVQTSIAHAHMYMTVLVRNGGGALPFHP